MKKSVNENVKFFGALVVLTGLLASLVFPFEIKTQAAAIQTESETQTVSDSSQKIDAGYGRMPLLFEMNKGQIDKEAKFVSRGAGYTLYLAKTEAVFQLQTAKLKSKSDVLKMRFAGANKNPLIAGIDEAITKTNYYTGKKKFENVANYKRANYKNLYDGIDAVFYGSANNQLEYDFVIAPNADANQINLDFDGAENVSVGEDDSLIVKTENTELVQQKPFAYQEIDGQKREISCQWSVVKGQSKSNKQVQFALGEYDKSKTLVIDPALSYLTYLGGSGNEIATAVKVDQNGNAFVAGSSNSINFPGPNPGSGNIKFAAFVSKISPDGQTILYTTFLDGSDDDGELDFNVGVKNLDITIDAAGSAYIAGTTESDNFPVTPNAYQRSRYCNRNFGACLFNEEGFVTKLNSQGTIVFSTYLGGGKGDFLHSIAVDSDGKAYVVGATSSGLTFPMKNQFQSTGVFGGSLDAFLTVFNPEGSDIVYSTGLSGNSTDVASKVALDSSNNVYVAGFTPSTNFPVKNSFQSVNNGGDDAFVAKFNTSLSGNASLIYSTYIGGAGTDDAFGIAVDASGQAYITGVTGSFNYPLQNAFRSTNQINEAFVTVLNSSGNALVNSSFLGGGNQDEGRDITLGNGGLIYVTGNTLSTDTDGFPTALPFQAANAGNRDAFVTKLKFGTGIISSSFLGGSGDDFGEGIDVRGNLIYVAGTTNSNNLATTSGVVQPNPGAGNSNATDGFVAKILDTAVDSVGVFRPQSTFILTQTTTSVIAQTALSTSALAGQKGISGDFDGDGMTTLGSFTNGTWKIRNSLVTAVVLGQPIGVRTITFGAGNDLPVVGDWNGDGIDTPGVFRPSTGQFTLTNSTSDTPSFILGTKVNFGLAGDLPIAGDWDGDGKDSIAVFRPSTGETFFTNQITQNPPIDFVAFIGINGDLPIAGDWNGDGKDSLGLSRPSTTEFFLSDDNVNLRPIFLFGQIGDQPLVGDWDGKPNQ
ncbi:MAG TPA: SBBP repeat-containing protein [Pyrinomonadaceae bacterium]|jgi:hypothetical protein